MHPIQLPWLYTEQRQPVDVTQNHFVCLNRLSTIVHNFEDLLSNTAVTDAVVDLVIELSTADDLIKRILDKSESC